MPVVRLLTALLKHQARVWLGEETAGVLADALIEAELAPRLDAWLTDAETQRRLQAAAEGARIWLQDPANCPDADLRALFHSLDFGTLPSVQAALARLPAALDARGLEDTLRAAFDRDLPTLPAARRAEAARLYTEALLRAVSTLEPFAKPAVRLLLFDVYEEVRRRGEEHEHILSMLKELKALLLTWIRSGVVSLPSPETLPGELPPGSHLPLGRNAAFTGREAALADLARALLPPDGETAAAPAVLVTQAITGLGGVGKTQLAVEFAYRYGYRFRGVHWLDLRDPTLLVEQIAENGAAMGLARVADEDLAAYAHRVLEAWKQDGPRLVILDNLEDVAAARKVLNRLHHHTLRLLLTARRRDWPPDLGLAVRPLEVFTPDESRAFLRRYLSPERAADADLDALAERLGHLPLALELAGRYLAYVRNLSVADDLERLEDPFAHPSMQGWKTEWGNPTEHDLNLWATFALSWEQVQDATARRLFRACAFLAPNAPIPDAILRLLEPDAERRGLALGRLRELGLWRENPQGPVVHPLLVEFARRLPEETPDEGRTFLVALADLASETNDRIDRTGDYALFAPLLPHVRAAAERGEALLPEVSASLWNSLGYHLNDLAAYAEARACFERALRIFEQYLGEVHPDVAKVVSNLGGVLKDLGNLEGARACFERALRILKATLPPNHPNIQLVEDNLRALDA